MTIIRIVSDIHLEFIPSNDFILEHTENESEKILVLSGDICIASSAKRFRYFFEDVSKRFKTVLIVMGNHEYYHGNILTAPSKLQEGALDGLKNVRLLNNDTFKTDDITFIGTTLWSDYDNGNPFSMMDCKQGMTDFRIIRHGTLAEPWRRKFDPADAIQLHITAKEFIFREAMIAKHEGKKVFVITHNAPSRQSIHPAYKDSPVNGAYVSDLDDEILESGIDVISHGHVHNSFDYHIGHTRVICNPQGYLGVEENPEFNPQFEIEL